MERISSLFTPIERPANKHEHEYQEVCSQLEPIYGRAIWTLPFKPFVTEYKLREAHKIAQQRGVKKIGYLIGILKRL